MYGSVVAWFFNTLAGISPDPDGGGWQNFVINPFTEGELTDAKASYNSVNGVVRSSWKKVGANLILDVEIPANCIATIHFPGLNPELVEEAGRKLQGRKEFKFLGSQNGKSLFKVGSGNYSFTVNVNRTASSGT